MSEAPRLRVLVAHRRRGFAEALAERLGTERDLEVVAVCTDGRKLELVLSLDHVDVLLLDWHFDEPDVRDEIQRLRGLSPYVRIAIIAQSDGATHALPAARAGVLGWIQTSEPVDRLCEAIRGVSRGEMWFPTPFVTAALSELMRDQDERDASRELIGSLTPRELVILRHLAAGLSRSDIARELYIRPDTVRTHVHNLLHRLGVHDSVAAVAIARRAGVTPSTPSRRLPHST
jgi:DNA-binding NarL/FixJ family response regulator